MAFFGSLGLGMFFPACRIFMFLWLKFEHFEKQCSAAVSSLYDNAGNSECTCSYHMTIQVAFI